MAFWRRIYGLFSGNATATDIGGQYPYPERIQPTQPIDEDAALKLSTVFRCVAITNNILGSTPINIIRDNSAIKDDLWDLLNLRPNPTQTGQEFRETMGLNYLLHGNAYARIARNTRGRIVALWHIPAQYMQVELNPNGSLTYVYSKPDGSKIVEYAQKDIVHVKNFGNGLTGLSTIAYAAESFSMALSAEHYSRDFYTGGGKPSAAVETDNILTEEQRKMFKQNIAQQSSQQGTMLLEAGFKYKQIQLSPADLETLSNRKYQNEDVARWFGVPLSLLGISDQATDRANGTEESIRGWLMTDLQPLLSRFENSFVTQLLSATERRTTEIKFDVGSILQYDMATLIEMGERGVRNGIMTQNEARKLVNLPPMEGDEFNILRQQAQMVDNQSKPNEDNTDDSRE